MARSTVAVRFTGDTANLKKSLNQVEGGFGKMSGRAKVALAGAATALVAFAGTSVKAYAEAETAQTKLSEAFEKFPQLAGENADALRELNSELAKKTKFDDDATASGQAVLAQFGLTADELKRITPLMQDFAEKTGQDLPTAATALGKAILGQGRALKQVGIDFTDTGSKAGNLDAIMVGLEQQVGGTAEAMGDTAAGKAAILSNQFGELQEKVGGALIPVLTDLADVGLQVLAFIENMPGPLKAGIGAVAGASVAVLAVSKLAGAVKGVGENLGPMVTGLKNARGAMSGLGGPALVAAGSIGVLVTAAHLLNDEADHADLSQLTNDLLDLSESGEAAGAVSDLLGEDFRTLQNAIEDIANPSVTAQAANAIHNLANLGQDDRDDLEDSTALIDDLDASLTELAAQDPAAAAAALEAIASGLSPQDAETLLGLLDDYDAALADIDTSSRTAAGGTDEFGNATGGTTPVVDEATAALEAEEEALRGVYDATIALFNSELGYRAAVDAAADAITDLATAQGEHGIQSEEYSDALRDAESAALGAADSAVQMAEDQYGAFLTTESASQIYRAELVRQRDALAPGSPLRRALDGYINRLDTVPPKKATQMVLDTAAADAKLSAYIRRLLGASLIRPGVPASIAAPGRAAGGPVRAGQPYIVGEEGPELMVPGRSGTIVPNGTRATTGTTVNVYVEGSVLSDRDLVAAINRAMAKGIR